MNNIALDYAVEHFYSAISVKSNSVMYVCESVAETERLSV